MNLQFKRFEGTLISWKMLFEEAANLATELGPARVRCISHSGSGGRGIVTVWYLDDPPTPVAAPTIPLRLAFEFERGTVISWDQLFASVAKRAAELLPEQILSISHSDSSGDGIVTLWYWDAAQAAPESEDQPTTDASGDDGQST